MFCPKYLFIFVSIRTPSYKVRILPRFIPFALLPFPAQETTQSQGPCEGLWWQAPGQAVLVHLTEGWLLAG